MEMGGSAKSPQSILGYTCPTHVRSMIATHGLRSGRAQWEQTQSVPARLRWPVATCQRTAALCSHRLPVFSYANQWWMFGMAPENPLSELRIWFADELEGNWQPHSGNPVRSDPRNTRPGGTPFLVGGHLYRPTQTALKLHGGSVVINRVDTLTRHSFKSTRFKKSFLLRHHRTRMAYTRYPPSETGP